EAVLGGPDECRPGEAKLHLDSIEQAAEVVARVRAFEEPAEGMIRPDMDLRLRLGRILAIQLELGRTHALGASVRRDGYPARALAGLLGVVAHPTGNTSLAQLAFKEVLLLLPALLLRRRWLTDRKGVGGRARAGRLLGAADQVGLDHATSHLSPDDRCDLA